MKKYLGLKHYIAFLRKSPKHMQHIYAAIFAGTITAIIGAVILYNDYGFWHERYVLNEKNTIVSTTTESQVKIASPLESVSNFFNQAKVQFKNIGKGSASLIESKETYNFEEN